MDKELHRCPGCGDERLASGAQWCKCNKSAPFRMFPASVTETVDALFGSIEKKQRRLSVLREIKKL